MTDDARPSLAFDTAMPAEQVLRAQGHSAAPGSDEADLAGARDGDEAAFASLYRRHAPKVFRFAWLLTGSESLADDVTQETFMHLLDAAGYDPARGSLPAYLCGIARHLALRTRDDRVSYVADIDAECEANSDLQPPALPLDLLERRRALERLYAAVRRLPSGFREVLILVELQEMSYADAAVAAGIELGTVRSRLSRARALLSALLHEGHR